MIFTTNSSYARILLLVLLLLHQSQPVTGFSVVLPRSTRTTIPSLLADTDYGIGMDQAAMMESDMLIVVDEHDNILREQKVSKKLAHSFSPETPRGVAHRAFSFFLFDKDNKLLLTRRADSKITFPGVWTNTACSHPLQQMSPSEVDDPKTQYPHFPGIKHAAVRKLKHELGITELLPKDMVFISRFHYWAADTDTHGPDAPWGEHEVDYVLFQKQPSSMQVKVEANPEEVDEYKYVSIEELKEMMDDPQLKWSPWFRGIMDDGGWKWWEDLENSLEGHNTELKVHFFDPPDAYYANYNRNESHTRQTGVIQLTTTAKQSK